ncbi:MAG TPA: DUF5671 domain-containing protein [Candidatus Paceibacterota bacterium]|nr:DUF5671 domain-containing protein [Candidatus Paceibacterota bacterium]
MERPKTTPKDFFLWAGAMIMLYGSAIAFITLLFNYINYAFPDALNYYWSDPYQGSMSFQIATITVMFPVFLLLMRVIRREIARDSSRGEIWIRRWALYLTLFIAGLTIVGDLITLLYYFLSGQDITVRFLLKVLVVLLVAGGLFMHFLADLWGYWTKYPNKARSIGWGVGALILATIIAGFFIIGTPWEARQSRIDGRKVSDLQQIQSQVVHFYQQKQRLPATLDELNDPLSYFMVPVDPETGQPYEYRATGSLAFELCAEFNKENQSRVINGRAFPARPIENVPAPLGGQVDNWSHSAGRHCYNRTIDPELYPPFQKPAPDIVR